MLVGCSCPRFVLIAPRRVASPSADTRRWTCWSCRSLPTCAGAGFRFHSFDVCCRPCAMCLGFDCTRPSVRAAPCRYSWAETSSTPEQTTGSMFNMDRPTEPLLMVGEEVSLRPLAARERKRRRGGSPQKLWDRVSFSGPLSDQKITPDPIVTESERPSPDRRRVWRSRGRQRARRRGAPRPPLHPWPPSPTRRPRG